MGELAADRAAAQDRPPSWIANEAGALGGPDHVPVRPVRRAGRPGTGGATGEVPVFSTIPVPAV